MVVMTSVMLKSGGGGWIRTHCVAIYYILQKSYRIQTDLIQVTAIANTYIRRKFPKKTEVEQFQNRNLTVLCTKSVRYVYG